jgi:hypothetical protein
LALARIEGLYFGNAKYAAQVTPGYVEQMRRNELRLFTIFDPVAKDAHAIPSLAWPALALLPVHSAAMFA